MPRKTRNQGFSLNSSRGGKKARNAHTTNDRLRVTQQFAEVVGVGSGSDRLRVTKQFAEVVGVGSGSDRLRVTQQFAETIISGFAPTPASLGWLRQFDLTKFAQAASVTLAIASQPTYAPQQIIPPAATPANLEWQNTVQETKRAYVSQDGFDSFAIGFSQTSTPVQTLNWQSTFDQTVSKTTRQQDSGYTLGASIVAQPTGWFTSFADLRGLTPSPAIAPSIAWDAQATFSLTRTPTNLEWQKPFEVVQGKTTNKVVFETTYQFNFTAQPNTLGWQSWFAPPPTVKVSPDLLNSTAWTPQVITTAQTLFSGWLQPSTITQPVKQRRDDNNFAWSSQQTFSLTGTPTQLGFVNPDTAKSTQTKNRATLDIAFAIGTQITPATFGWYGQFDLPKAPVQTGKNLSAWTPQATFSLTGTPTQLGFLSPDSARQSQANNLADLKNVIAGPVYPYAAAAQTLFSGWMVAAQQQTQVLNNTNKSVFAWTPQTITSFAITPTQFGWQQSFDTPKPKLPAQELVTRTAWTAQQTFSLTGTPAQFGWQQSFSALVAQPVRKLENNFQFGFTTQAPILGWFTGFSSTPPAKANPDLRNTIVYAVNQPAVVQTLFSGWMATNQPAAKPVRQQEAFNTTVWAPQILPAATPTQLGWQQPFATIPAKPAARVVDNFVLGQPQFIPSLGWYIAFDQPRTVAKKPPNDTTVSMSFKLTGKSRSWGWIS